MFLLVNNRPIQSADSIGFWPIVSVSADSQNSTIVRPLLKLKIDFVNYFKKLSCPFLIAINYLEERLNVKLPTGQLTLC